jgi:hypothetical protein
MPETKDLIDPIISTLHELRKEMGERFGAIDRRFEGINKRLEEVASHYKTHRTPNDQPSDLK